MTAPSLPSSLTMPIFKAQYVSPAKRTHPLSSPPIPETLDDGNYNLENTFAQIQATMAASFASLQQDITTLRSLVTTLTTTNQTQTKEIHSLATTIQYLFTLTKVQQIATPLNNNKIQQTPR